MTTVDEAAREGSSLQSAVPDGNPKNAQRARSVTLPSHASLNAVTQRVRSGAGSAAKKAQLAGANAAKAANTKDSLIHSQPPTFAQSWQHHKAHIDRHDALLLKVPRHAWALVHVGLIKPLLNLVEWITARPVWTGLVLAGCIALWIWG